MAQNHARWASHVETNLRITDGWDIQANPPFLVKQIADVTHTKNDYILKLRSYKVTTPPSDNNTRSATTTTRGLPNGVASWSTCSLAVLVDNTIRLFLLFVFLKS